MSSTDHATPTDAPTRRPANRRELILEAAIDPDNDGPTPGDPFGQCDQNPVRIGDEDVDGLTITVSG